MKKNKAETGNTDKRQIGLQVNLKVSKMCNDIIDSIHIHITPAAIRKYATKFIPFCFAFLMEIISTKTMKYINRIIGNPNLNPQPILWFIMSNVKSRREVLTKLPDNKMNILLYKNENRVIFTKTYNPEIIEYFDHVICLFNTRSTIKGTITIEHSIRIEITQNNFPF